MALHSVEWTIGLEQHRCPQGKAGSAHHQRKAERVTSTCCDILCLLDSLVYYLGLIKLDPQSRQPYKSPTVSNDELYILCTSVISDS